MKAFELARQAEKTAGDRLDSFLEDWAIEAEIDLRACAAELRRLAAVEAELERIKALEALENGARVRNAEGGTKYQPPLEEAAIKAIRNHLGVKHD